jgi:hypothetical protein
MSTILKALRRLEEDRSAQSERPLREEVTRGGGPSKPRRGAGPLLAVLLVLGLGIAGGAGLLVYRYLGGTPEPARPTELAAVDSAKPRAKPVPAAERSRRPSAARPARKRASPPPAAAPSAAAQRELPTVALSSKVEVIKRPPAEPRIAASEPGEPPAHQGASRELPRPLDPAEIPGRHKRESARSASAPEPVIAAPAEASEPPSAPAEPEESARSQLAAAGSAAPPGKPAATEPAESKARAEPAPALPAEPRVVAMAPEPTAVTPATAAGDAERQAAEPKPEPTQPREAAERSSQQPAKSAAATPRDSEPEEAGPREVARAEIPSLRVESTVWHPLAERRVAVIEFDRTAERREIREGDSVGPLVVSKIEPSGIIFVHDGVEMRRRIGE